MDLLQPLPLLQAVQGPEARQELVVLRIVDPGLVDRTVLDLRGPEADPGSDPERVLHALLARILGRERPGGRTTLASGEARSLAAVKNPKKNAPTPSGLGAASRGSEPGIATRISVIHVL